MVSSAYSKHMTVSRDNVLDLDGMLTKPEDGFEFTNWPLCVVMTEPTMRVEATCVDLPLG